MDNAPVILDIDDADSETDQDPPLKILLKNLTKNDTKKTTILTNGQLVEILRKQYNMDVYTMHKLEIEIYLNVMKKFLKEWSKWEEFDTKIVPLRKKKDVENIQKVVEEQYSALVEHLKTTLGLAKPLIDETIKKLKEETKAPAGDCDVVMEVASTRDQLNQLFYRTPTSDLSTSVFNIDCFIQSRINLATWSLASILHMWNVKVSLTLNSLIYKREMTHSLKHMLLNKMHTIVHPIDALNTDFQVKTTRPKDVTKEQLLTTFQSLLLMYECTENYPILREIFTILTNDLDEAPDVLNVPAKYRRHMNKYPYVRYLYTDNTDQHPEKTNRIYDLQLEEIVSPMFQISIGKLDSTSLEMPNFEVWLVIECGSCKAKFYGADMQEKLETHFNERHQNEPDWTCSNCMKKFNMRQLTEQRWTHSC